MYLTHYIHLAGITISDLLQECTESKAPKKPYLTLKPSIFAVLAETNFTQSNAGVTPFKLRQRAAET